MFNMMPWRGKKLPIHRQSDNSLQTLQQELNELFDQYFGAIDESSFRNFPPVFGDRMWGDLSPAVDMSETDKELVVKFELPGVNEKELDISLTRDTLKISGEKKQEREETEKGWYRMERQYGSFARSIALPCEVDSDKVEATYKHGVLKIVLPKSAAQEAPEKVIPVKTAV